MQCVYIVKLSVLVRCGEVLGNGPVILTLRLQPISLNRPSAKSTRYLKAKMLQSTSWICKKFPEAQRTQAIETVVLVCLFGYNGNTTFFGYLQSGSAICVGCTFYHLVS